MRRAALLLLVAAAPGQEEGTRMDEANREAADRIRRTFAERTIKPRLRGLRKEDVIVVGGLFDFVQEVLKAHEAEFTVVTPAELEHVPLDGPERKLLFLNCHLLDRKFPDAQPAAARLGEEEAARALARVLAEAGLDEEGSPGQAIRQRFQEVKHFAGSDYSVRGLERLGRAVREGAWAFSTDWAVLAWERALPGTIRWTGHKTFEEKVEVRASLVGRRHGLLEGVFADDAKPRWWIETGSYLFSVRGKHTRLVESSQLAARYGGNRSVVALLEPGQGRVVHALTHGYLQQGNAEDVGPMQRLIVNLLLEKSLQNWKRK